MQMIGSTHQNSCITSVNVISTVTSDSIIAIINTGMHHAGTATINGIMPTVITIDPGAGIQDTLRTNMRGRNIIAEWSDIIVTMVDTTVHATVVIPIATFIFASTTGIKMKYTTTRQPAGSLLAARRSSSFSLGSGMPD